MGRGGIPLFYPNFSLFTPLSHLVPSEFNNLVVARNLFFWCYLCALAPFPPPPQPQPFLFFVFEGCVVV